MSDDAPDEAARLVVEMEIVGVIVVSLPQWRPVPSPHDPELGWTTTDHDETW